jgi:hypothetical protein
MSRERRLDDIRPIQAVDAIDTESSRLFSHDFTLTGPEIAEVGLHVSDEAPDSQSCLPLFGKTARELID